MNFANLKQGPNNNKNVINIIMKINIKFVCVQPNNLFKLLYWSSLIK